MGTAGAYAGVAFSFNYSFVDSATPSSFFATDLTTSDVTVYSRSGSTTGAGAAIASAPTRSGSIYTFTLSTSEMVGDEVLLECAKTGMVSETISIALEPTPSDISEVQKVAVSGVSDFKADVSSLATASALTVVDTEVGQIKAKTDQLTFTVSNQVDANALTGGSDATAANQSTIINHLTDVKGAGWTSTDNLAEITEDVTGLNGAAMRGTDGAVTTAAPTAADIYSEFTSGSNEDAFKADVSGLATASALSTVDGKIDTLDTVADSILADTGTDGVVLSTATLESIADTILKRDVDNVEATANEHTLATIILCLLESSRSSTTWTIKRSDGVTTHATKTLTLDSTADPVIGVD